MVDQAAFQTTFQHFISLVEKYDGGHPFTSFDEGLVGAYELYKLRLREYARGLLLCEEWNEGNIGNGAILERAISAIEIQDSRRNIRNNLVFWQNRYGHDAREHKVLLEARADRKMCRLIERGLFDLYRTEAEDGIIFDRLAELLHRKYTLLAYLFFLKDSDRFCPIQPTGYDLAFKQLGVALTTLRNCNWANYSQYNQALQDVRAFLEEIAGLRRVRLIDAHSFCWVYITLLRRELGRGTSEPRTSHPGRIVEARERCIVDMKYSIIQTAQQSRGQTVERLVQLKVKDLGFDQYQLDTHLRQLMHLQEDRCALTGIPFQFDGDDLHLRPSPDRKDSSGHYVAGNIQIVCRFVNFWKRDTPNEDFVRLLSLVRAQTDEGVPNCEDAERLAAAE